MRLPVLKTFVLFVLMESAIAAVAAPGKFEIGTNDFLLEGKPFQIRCGEMHAARVPVEYWQHRLRMARAMGLNTVCAYLFWNLHEPSPGKFSFSDRADMARFCRLAQEEGLKVILRPGPYACAEWDFGGFPYWLLKDPDMKVRTQYPAYLAACKRYLEAVGRELAPLQITRGGPIIMVQVENEYGSYGKDREYIGTVRDYLKAAGFEVPLFTCDGPVQLKNDSRDDIFCVVNFGSDPEKSFKALREVRPTGPLMCGEYYPGWFDSWGKPHHIGDTTRIVREIGWMLEHNASFSIYMVHGGTSFGFSVGANSPPFSPQLTSYDYDAPISEAGWATPKFYELRALLSKHLAPGEKLPDVPGSNAVVSIPPIEFKECAPVFQNLPRARKQQQTSPMEMFDQSNGCILYRTQLPAGPAGELRIEKVHDYALVFLDGRKIETLERRLNQNTAKLPARRSAARLDILVDTFGRVNYGADIHDRKGITDKVAFAPLSESVRMLTNWEVFNLPLNKEQIGHLKFKKAQTGEPAFYRASFGLKRTGDTFLDMRSWGKGVVWVNGHNLGRFWNLGPQQTLYCPGPWLRKGANEIVVLELNGAKAQRIPGLEQPILDQLSDAAMRKNRNSGETLDLSGIKPVASGSFAPGKDWQACKFAGQSARYLCFETLSSIDGSPLASCAELRVLDAAGHELSREQWQVVYADSEEVENQDCRASNVYDGKPATFWQTEWKREKPAHPHQVVLDLGFEQVITGISYLPRQDSPNGQIKEFRIYARPEPFPIRK